MAVSAYRAGTGSRATYVATQQQQIHDLLDVRDRILMLRDAHRPTADHRLRLRDDGGQRANARFLDAGAFGDSLPGLGRQIVAVGVEAVGELADERAVDAIGV